MNIGCSQVAVTDVPQARRNLMMISEAYTKATDQMQRPPANLDELLPFLKEKGDPVEILQSPNDGQNFVILYGVDYRVIQIQPVTVYEKTGKDGQRLVLRGRVIFTLGDEEFKRTPFPPGQKGPF